MPRKTPEEDWINEPESEGEHDFYSKKHSPYEGDIPPWGQTGYKGDVPTAGKIFYVNGYVLHLGDPPQENFPQTYQENLRSGRSLTVGTYPPGLELGSDGMYYPFAAIPIRFEDRKRKEEMFYFLTNLAQKLEFPFVRIETEKDFPDKGECTLPNGRWFPYETKRPFAHPKLSYMNGYNANRAYGGPEEGGWWYDTGEAVASIPLYEPDDIIIGPDREKWKDYLDHSVGWHSQYGLGSVLGRDVFDIRLQGHFAMDYPQQTPHFE